MAKLLRVVLLLVLVSALNLTGGNVLAGEEPDDPRYNPLKNPVIRPERFPFAEGAPGAEGMQLMEDTRALPYRPRGEAGPSLTLPAASQGEAGTAYALTGVFGEMYKPYVTNEQYLNQPAYLARAADGIWILESAGKRLVKYNWDGRLIAQIGTPGMGVFHPQYNLNNIAGISTDAAGNLWLLNYTRAILINPQGTLLATLGAAYAPGTGNNQFGRLSDMAISPAGTLFFADRTNHRVQIFNASRTYLATIGTTGVAGTDATHLNAPVSIGLGGSLLYVLNGENNILMVFDVSNPAAPLYRDQFTLPGEAGSRDHLYVEGSEIYVTWDKDPAAVEMYSYSAGSLTKHREETFEPHSYFVSTWWISDLLRDDLGYYYLADPYRHMVRRFDPNFQKYDTLGNGSPFVENYQLLYAPYGIDVDPDGSVIVAQLMSNKFSRIDPLGNVSLAHRNYTALPSYITDPVDVAVSPLGNRFLLYNWGGFEQVTADWQTVGEHQYGYPSWEGEGLNYPTSLALSPDKRLYISDTDNQRIRVLNPQSGYAEAGTLGEFGVRGTDNLHFNYPQGVHVDAQGNVYVADGANNRVQVFNSAHQYVRTIGLTGVASREHGLFDQVSGIVTDGMGNIFVGDLYNGRVQVFNNQGQYLTTLGGQYLEGDYRWWINGVGNLAVDALGQVYVTDYSNMVVLRFSPGVRGWTQRNLNGFGDIANTNVLAITPFRGLIYAGTLNEAEGAKLYRSNGEGRWEQLNAPGFGNKTNVGIDVLFEFQNMLYAGTWNEQQGAEIWRSGDGSPGSWVQVMRGGFGSVQNREIISLQVINGALCAGTWGSATGQLWCSSSGAAGSWVQRGGDGLGNPANRAILSGVRHGTQTCLATFNQTNGAQVLCSSDGLSWAVRTPPGGTPARFYGVLAEWNNGMYAGFYGNGSGEIWRCQACDGSDWAQLSLPAEMTAGVQGVDALKALGARLYAVERRPYGGGLMVWSTADGVTWSEMVTPSFGDWGNWTVNYNNGLAWFNDTPWVATANWGNGGEVWQMNPVGDEWVFLPAVRR